LTGLLEIEHLWTPAGWLSPAFVAIGPDGGVVRVEPVRFREAGAATVERVAGYALPGMPNLHSHAFQRGLAGLAERAAPGGDTFWTWRETMYRFVARLAPEDVEAIAAQLYVEMLRAGYTAVAEFHYLHHDPDGRPYAPPTRMADHVLAAARRAGIGITILPALYAAGGFGGAPPEAGQRRFATDAPALLRLVEALRQTARGDPAARVGAAPHSLRAAPPAALADLLAGLERLDATAPIHVHVAEQRREVEECLAARGTPPVAWLLDHAPVDSRWCLVHATHVGREEIAGIARSGAVAGLCPTTEANLGDGVGPAAALFAAGAAIGIGSDSHVSVSVVEELRWLEYAQRLTGGRRTVLAGRAGGSVGERLWAAALEGGTRAVARPVGAVAPGRRADVVVLDPGHPVLAERAREQVLDAFVFAGDSTCVRDVMVGGRWVVRDRRHPDEGPILDAYRRTLRRLA
jgi:formimidoylglutamate deiminase